MNNLVSILLPVRDEEENVKIISKEIINKISYQNFEILFINDFSKDNTEKEIIELMKSSNKIVYYNNQNIGLGGAIDTGIKKAKGDYVCIMMADSSDTVEDLNLYINTIINTNLDAVFGSRFVKGSKVINYPLLKLFFNRVGNFCAKFMLLTKLNDFTNGFKIYKKEVLLNLYPLVSESFNIFLELPMKTISRGFSYKIVPISYYNRTVGVAKFKIQELSFKYIFTLLYCFLEKILLNKKIK